MISSHLNRWKNGCATWHTFNVILSIHLKCPTWTNPNPFLPYSYWAGVSPDNPQGERFLSHESYFRTLTAQWWAKVLALIKQVCTSSPKKEKRKMWSGHYSEKKKKCTGNEGLLTTLIDYHFLKILFANRFKRLWDFYFVLWTNFVRRRVFAGEKETFSLFIYLFFLFFLNTHNLRWMRVVGFETLPVRRQSSEAEWYQWTNASFHSNYVSF